MAIPKSEKLLKVFCNMGKCNNVSNCKICKELKDGDYQTLNKGYLGYRRKAKYCPECGKMFTNKNKWTK